MGKKVKAYFEQLSQHEIKTLLQYIFRDISFIQSQSFQTFCFVLLL